MLRIFLLLGSRPTFVSTITIKYYSHYHRYQYAVILKGLSIFLIVIAAYDISTGHSPEGPGSAARAPDLEKPGWKMGQYDVYLL